MKVTHQEETEKRNSIYLERKIITKSYKIIEWVVFLELVILLFVLHLIYAIVIWTDDTLR